MYYIKAVVAGYAGNAASDPSKSVTLTVTYVYFGPSFLKLEWNVKSVRCTVLPGWTHQVLS